MEIYELLVEDALTTLDLSLTVLNIGPAFVGPMAMLCALAPHSPAQPFYSPAPPPIIITSF